MAPKLPALGMHSLIVSLPDFDLPDLVPDCEVLWQEGIRVWTVSVDRIDNLPELLRLFGRRAKLGVHGVMEPEQVRSAATAGALFAACDFLRPQLVDATPELPVILGGMTPTELLAGLDAGAAAVQLVPSDAFGSSLARSCRGCSHRTASSPTDAWSPTRETSGRSMARSASGRRTW